MSGTRVKSTKITEEAKPSGDTTPKKAGGTLPEADLEEAGEDGPEAEDDAEDASQADSEAEEGDEEEDTEESDENPQVTGLTPMEVAAGQRRSGKKRAPPKIPDIPDGHEAILTSPRKFGIWINGALHEFQKGRTPLTNEQHDAAHMDSYVRDNGASVSYRPKVKKPKAK